MKILLIEDDKYLAKAIKEKLSKYYVVEMVHTGKEGEDYIRMNGFDLVVLDLALPDMTGVDVCKHIRKSKINIPILMLTGSFEVSQKVLALDSGADDYLTKPFSFDELLARVRALLRRKDKPLEAEVLSVGDLTLLVAEGVVERQGNQIKLRRKQLRLLEYLMRNVGRVVTREMIMNNVWGHDNESMNNIVDVHIKYLRDLIDKPFEKKLIKTLHGLGYKLEA